jgi:hypothetical protein
MNRNCCIFRSEVDEITVNSRKLPMAADQRIGFGVCANCGMILQSTTPTIDEVIEHYKNAATYTNDGRLGRPSEIKVAAVSRQIRCILKDINVPESVFKVGCSDGYTLSQFIKRDPLECPGSIHRMTVIN